MTTELSDTTIDLLESIDESVRELESPALDHVEGQVHRVSDDCVCGCCGDQYRYGDTYITTHFEFEKTPDGQEDRVCWSCLGRYLDVGSWEKVANDGDGVASPGGSLRSAWNDLISANIYYAMKNDIDVRGENGEYIDHLGILEQIEAIEDVMVEIGEMEEHDVEAQRRRR